MKLLVEIRTDSSQPKRGLLVRVPGTGSLEFASQISPELIEGGVRLRDIILHQSTTGREKLQAYGEDLFDAIFKGPLRDEFFWRLGWAEAVSRMEGENHPLQLLLSVNGQTALDLPWELMFLRQRQEFLTLSHSVVFARTMGALSSYPQLRRRPIRIGFLVSAPNNQGKLGFYELSRGTLMREVDLVRRALAPLIETGAVVCDSQIMETKEQFLQRSSSGSEPLQVLHVIGHGRFRVGAGELLLSDKNGEGCLVDAAWFRAQVRTDCTRLVVLNCCQTSRCSDEPLSGVARSLAAQGIPAVIGMGFEVPNEFAERFAQHLYSQITQQDSPRIEVCVREARRASVGDKQSKCPAWMAPVLFSQLEGQPIFEFGRKDHAQHIPLHFHQLTSGHSEYDGSNAQLSGADFSQRELSHANFTRATLSSAIFRGAALRHAQFVGAGLNRAVFCEADLSGADFSNAHLTHADFRGATLKGAILHAAWCHHLKFNDSADIRACIGWKHAHWDEETRRRLFETPDPGKDEYES